MRDGGNANIAAPILLPEIPTANGLRHRREPRLNSVQRMRDQCNRIVRAWLFSTRRP